MAAPPPPAAVVAATRTMMWVTIVGLAAVALYTVWNLADRSSTPSGFDGYRYRNDQPATWDYPLHDVVVWSLPIAASALAAALVLARKTAGGGDAVVLGLLAAVLCVSGAVFAMHAPATYGAIVVWLFLAAAWLIPIGFLTIVVTQVQRWRARRGDV